MKKLLRYVKRLWLKHIIGKPVIQASYSNTGLPATNRVNDSTRESKNITVSYGNSTSSSQSFNSIPVRCEYCKTPGSVKSSINNKYWICECCTHTWEK